MVAKIGSPGAELDRGRLRDFARVYRGAYEPAAALRWGLDPAAAAHSGAPSPATELAELRRRLYRRDANSEDVAAYRAAERRVAHEVELIREALTLIGARATGEAPPDVLALGAAIPQPPAAPAVEVAEHGAALQPGPSRRPGRRWAALVIGLIVLSGVLGAAIGSRGSSSSVESSGLHDRTFEQNTFRSAIAHGDGSLAPQDYFQFHPGQLPALWTAATEAQSFRRLRDKADLTVSTARVTQTLLVAVACPADAGTWSAEVIGRDGTLRRGSCGELQPQQLPVVSGFDSVRLRIELAGSGRFAVSAYQR